MSFYLHDADAEQAGPYSLDVLGQMYGAGNIRDETRLYTENDPVPITYGELRALKQPPIPGSTPNGQRTGRSPRRPFRYFLWPFSELHRLGDIDNRSLLALTGIGLIPLLLFTLSIGLANQTFVFFLTALYFSVLWAILFYHVFPAPNIRIGTSIYCFLGSGLVSISLLVGFFRLPFIALPVDWLNSALTATRASAFLFWVAIPEELCKLLMIYVLSKRPEIYLPRTLAYYGMICGLGFGIYEGLDYQLDRNLKFAESQAEYLFLNLLRLTSIPVLHAVWTGIASYFLGFAFLYPHRKGILAVVALAVPAVLHALFNTFNGTLTSLGISLLSVLILILYLSKHDAFDIFLGRETHLRNRV